VGRNQPRTVDVLVKHDTLQGKVLPSLLGGTSRHPLPIELIRSSGESSELGLAMLSLTGQALRFERPATPESFIVDPEIADSRKILAYRLRRPLIRLLTAKNSTGHPARALARAFDRLRMRPHPFDLPMIDGFARSYAEKLGPTAQHWVARLKPEASTPGYFDPELVNESNWPQAALSRRVAYLEQRRREDADAARALVESRWAEEDADARFRLLQVFQTGLSMADEPFLTSLAKDRGPRVRGLAGRLLARLGASSTNPALEACVERIRKGQSGLLRQRTTLQLELPANVKDQAAPPWIRQAFTDVSFGELGGAFKLQEDELIEAAAKDEPLLVALALMATDDRRLDLLDAIVAHLPNAWERMFESGLDSLGAMSNAERQRWEEILLLPYGKDLPATYSLWDWLHRITDVETTPAVMSRVLDMTLLAEVPEQELSNAFWMDVIAAICPASQREELRARLTRFDASQTAAPLTLLQILDGMENDYTDV
jgi:hypothetical protein